MNSKKIQVSKYYFLNDQPTSEDEIGTHSKIAESLLEIIHSNLKRPFVVGLFGQWGVGKSSIVQMLQKKVEEADNDTKVVVIDAWQYSRETFLRQFIKILAVDLLKEKEAEEVIQEVNKRRIENTSTWDPGKKGKIWFKRFILAVALLIILTLILFFWCGNDFPGDKIAGMLLIALVAVYFQFILPKYSVKTDSREEDVTLHDISHFRRVYCYKIIAKCKPSTICMVIDNLDRVDPEDAISIMRDIKSFIVDTGCDEACESDNIQGKAVFVVPCDDQALRNVLKSKGYEKTEDSNGFLRKFFNVNLRIPSFREMDCYRYASTLLNKTNLKLDHIQLDKIAHIITSLFGLNPRQPKIFINNLLARYISAEGFERDGRIQAGVVTDHVEWFAVYVALDTEFADLPMPNTLDGLRKLLKDNKDGRERQRISFLQKVEGIVERIRPEAWAAYHYLKRPNYALMIEGYPELQESALRCAEDFPDKLIAIRVKEPNIIEVLWDDNKGDETQVMLMKSILSAKEQDVDLQITGTRVANEMANIIAKRILDLPSLPAGVVYRDILKPRETILWQILYDMKTQGRGDEKAELYTRGSPREFQVELVKEILKDEDVPVNVAERLGTTLDFLGNLTDDLTIPAIECGKFTSATVMEKGIKFFLDGRQDLNPIRLVTFCGNFEEKKCVQYLQKIVQLLNQNLRGSAYKTKDLCQAAMKVKELIDRVNEAGVNVGQVEVTNTVTALDSRYERDQEWDNRYLILKTLWEYSKFKAFPQLKNNAKSNLVNRGNHFLRLGEENTVIKFLEKEQEVIKAHFQSVLPETAARSEELCYFILDNYRGSTQSVIVFVFSIQPKWVVRWVEKGSTNMGQRIVEVQSALLAVASQTNYKIEVYECLSFLNVSECEEARQSQENHFSNLLRTQEPLTSIEKLVFVLERILTSNYKVNEEQGAKIDQAINKIDQSTLSDEQGKLIRNYSKLKKSRGRSIRRES
jgi:hypothetical protein